jgi:hypothetical protein
MMAEVLTSEISVNLRQSTRRYNPEDSHLHKHCRQNFKSYIFNVLGFGSYELLENFLK